MQITVWLALIAISVTTSSVIPCLVINNECLRALRVREELFIITTDNVVNILTRHIDVVYFH